MEIYGLREEEVKELNKIISNFHKRAYEAGAKDNLKARNIGYDKGLNDAWKMAKIIYKMSAGDLIRTFGMVGNWVHFSAEEAGIKMREAGFLPEVDGITEKTNVLSNPPFAAKPTPAQSRADEIFKFLSNRFKEKIPQFFFSRNLVGDITYTIYNQDKVTIENCPSWDYIEILGLTRDEEKEFEEKIGRKEGE